MGTQMTKLPTPEQWVLSKMSEMEVAEMIERYIDYVDDEGRSVHLPMPFVRHYMRRDDNASPSESHLDVTAGLRLGRRVRIGEKVESASLGDKPALR
jgi:hypothetical protein